MKKYLVISILFALVTCYSCLVRKKGKQALYELQESPVSASEYDSTSILNSYPIEPGDPQVGYQYLLYGNAFSSGIPSKLYKKLLWSKNTVLASITGYNKYVLNDFVEFKSENGRLTATPGCLHCHSQQFNGKLIIGLGNSYSNFQDDKTSYLKIAERIIRFAYGKNSEEWKTSKRAFETGYFLAPETITEMQGPTAAHRILEMMAAHRDPQTLLFRSDTSYFSIPPIVIPSDIPPLWNSKKKKAFTINAMEQGDLLKHLMSPTILLFRDTSEANEIYKNMKNLWAYITTLKAPEYPYSIDQNSAERGKLIFLKTCSTCHGTYGENQYYPEKLIPINKIGTDSLMVKYYSNYPEFAEWFNNSWFARFSSPAYIRPQPGYVAPPLNGVWVSAPYFHNGSVPTVEAVLNSKIRPRYWKRSFSKEKYDYRSLGWEYKTLSSPGGKRTYNTDIPGYGNYGHYFGDRLTDSERKDLIEYLKTL